ncbi:MAG TPA: AAA family ATPase [Thermoleophilaceae bacterium]|jgi:DNA-binding SARP family transcriptional activator|nr:AAA family ATPase [Thermoleophilaceae bacterium]
MTRSTSLHRADAALSPVASSIGNALDQRTEHPLQVQLLGGFRVERVDAPGLPVCTWQRRSAKRLTKLLATHPRHALHREQILEMLWPDVGFESALNSFGKALYAARRALEPDLLARGSSAYLTLIDGMLALNTELVEIDADRFQQLAETALRSGDVTAYESALAAHGGELLPEDRYEDWCSERRDFLAELHIRLLLGLADALEQRGSLTASADLLREVLQQDPTREDVHRRLMVLYARMGMRDQAVRQFHLCDAVLRRELDLAPESATTALFEEVLANRIPAKVPTPGSEQVELQPPEQSGPDDPAGGTPFVGHARLLRRLRDALARADEGAGSFILIGGEGGVGKSRLAAEVAAMGRERGACVLRGGSAGHVFGPFAVALENYVAGQSDGERSELAQRYPALGHVVPSLGLRRQLPPVGDRVLDDDLCLSSTMVRLLADRTQTGPVVLVVEDLHELHRSSLDLLQYLVLLAGQRRWLIVATFREGALEIGTDRWRVIEAMAHEPVCLRVELTPLERRECDQLVRALLEHGQVAEAALDHVYAWSQGSPLVVEELVREMQQRDELVLTGRCWHVTPGHSVRVPRRVRTLVATRLASVDEGVRRVLALAAAAGGEPSLSELRAAAAALRPPISETALFDALDRALETRILVERNRVYAFRHPLDGPALYEELPTHRRDELQAALRQPRAADDGVEW